MECPLYDNMRHRVYKQLDAHAFDFTTVNDLQGLFVAMLSVGAPSATRAVGRFLADCLAARDLYLQREKPSAWITKDRRDWLLRQLGGHNGTGDNRVAPAPTTCEASLTFLQMVTQLPDGTGFNTATCATLATHLAHYQLSQGNLA